jgi:hypothetical protein
MAIQKRKLSQSEVSIEIDLEKLLGGMAKDQAVREVFFQAAFDKMLERLDEGVGADGKNLPKYSKAYKDSLEYIVYGKDGTVNMQLTGGMVNSIDILKSNDKKMTVGFKGDEENAKAYGHLTGFAGHPTLDGKVKPRNFFGWTDTELIAIASDLKSTNQNDESRINDSKILSLLDRLVG